VIFLKKSGSCCCFQEGRPHACSLEVTDAFSPLATFSITWWQIAATCLQLPLTLQCNQVQYIFLAAHYKKNTMRNSVKIHYIVSYTQLDMNRRHQKLFHSASAGLSSLHTGQQMLMFLGQPAGFVIITFLFATVYYWTVKVSSWCNHCKTKQNSVIMWCDALGNYVAF